MRGKRLERLPGVTSGKGMEFLVTIGGFVFGGLGVETRMLAMWKQQIKFVGFSLSRGSKGFP